MSNLLLEEQMSPTTDNSFLKKYNGYISMTSDSKIYMLITIISIQNFIAGC